MKRKKKDSDPDPDRDSDSDKKSKHLNKENEPGQEESQTEKDSERDRDRDSDKNSEDMNQENEPDQEESQKKTEDDAKEAAKTRKSKFTLLKKATDKFVSKVKEIGGGGLKPPSANTSLTGFITPIKTGLLLLFIGALSWSIYYLYPLINENLKISSRIKETTSKIDLIQTEQIQIKEALNSFQNKIDQKLKFPANNETSQGLIDTVSKLSGEITALQNEIKTLRDQVKNNSTLLVSRQNQIIDLPSQKNLTTETEIIEKVVDKNGHAVNEVVILIEDSVQLLIKSMGNAFTKLKNTLKNFF